MNLGCNFITGLRMIWQQKLTSVHESFLTIFTCPEVDTSTLIYKPLLTQFAATLYVRNLLVMGTLLVKKEKKKKGIQAKRKAAETW